MNAVEERWPRSLACECQVPTRLAAARGCSRFINQKIATVERLGAEPKIVMLGAEPKNGVKQELFGDQNWML